MSIESSAECTHLIGLEFYVYCESDMDMPAIEMSNPNAGEENVQNNGEEYDDTVLDNNQPLDEANYEVPVAPVLSGPPGSSAQEDTYQELQ